MVGYVAEAFGGAFAGFLYTYILEQYAGWTELTATNLFFYMYAGFGFAMFLCYAAIDNSTGI